MPTLSPRYLGADVPPLAFIYVWATMLFPGDADRRREFRNALAASACRERLKKGQPVPADLAERLIAAPPWRRALKGADAAERDGRFAGAVLGTALQLIGIDHPERASRGRIFAASSEIRLGNGSGRRSSQKTMFRAWRRHRAVAHLWLPRILVGEDAFFGLATDRHRLLAFIAAAEAFRRRGEAWIPHHGREPLLDPAEMWRVPDTVALPSVTAPLGHPSAERLELLRRARAAPRW
ncbi:MAG: hypothetical protein U1E66_08125 [Rhodospirillales bacterium]